MNNLRDSRGFTLVEMLIAIAISAMVAAMAYETFDGASRNAERTRDVLNSINKLDKAWQLIGQDMRNIVPINPKIPALPGTNPPRFEASSLKTKGKDAFQVVTLFSRRGWFNPLGRVRSDLLLVNYRIAEGRLWRDYLPERNVPLENIDFERASFHQLLLGEEPDVNLKDLPNKVVVTDFQVRLLSDSRIKSNGKSVLEGNDFTQSWDDVWPPLGGSATMPIAIEITIEVEGVGRSARLFELPQP